MNVTSPLHIDGDTFTHYSVNLAITSKYVQGKEVGNVALRLIPTKINDDGSVTTKDNHANAIFLGSTVNLQEPEKTAVESIHTALQSYIAAKGL